jgi:hypothetical protein
MDFPSYGRRVVQLKRFAAECQLVNLVILGALWSVVGEDSVEGSAHLPTHCG